MSSAALVDLGLAVGDPKPLLARGAHITSRGEVRAAADALCERLRTERIARVLVRSDDPEVLLRAIDATHRAGADLWIAHTSLSDAALGDLLDRFAIELVLGGEADTARRSADGPAPAGCVHLMTSGTTGVPKVARHTLEALVRRARLAAALPENRGGRWLLTYQPTGFAGVQVLLTAVLSGGLVVVPTQRTPAAFFDAATTHDVRYISGTPTFWRSFLMVARPGEPPLRQITLGGEAADQSILDRVRAAYPDARITHIYASTEAGVVFAVHDGVAGFPAAWLDQTANGVELRIVDELLQIRAPSVMHGYAAAEGAQPVGDDGWLRTADRCQVAGDRVRWLGRQDATINVGGSKVYPLMVESFLLSQPGVSEARVFGVRNPISGQLVAAEVVLSAGFDPAEARPRILAACRAAMPGYQVPRQLAFVEAIAAHTSGKKG